MNEKITDKDNEKLVKEFGASRISHMKDLPDFYTFNNGLIHSHRDFHKFLEGIKKGEKCAILSGFNASGTIHLGHKPVFDTNLFLQKKYNIPVYIPISDDESYVTGKVDTQEEALKNSLELAKELIAYGFDPNKTFFIIDQIYTNIYNLSIKLSKKVNLSEIKSTYGYKNEDNIGMHFYPAIQSAHILFPQSEFNFKHVLVPIGPDEDAHLRISRDIASRANLNKPATVHATFIPGLDGNKMSKSKNNAVFLKDSKETIIKKVNRAFSGGQQTIDEHRKKGGNPNIDISCLYLSKFFLTKEQSKKLFTDYKSGKLLSKDIKKMLADKLIKLTKEFQNNIKKVTRKDLEKTILTNNENLKL